VSEFAPILAPIVPAEPFEVLVNLASERLGAVALAANDDFFAPKENLVKDEAAVWKEGLYTDDGKWMDGWETRRRRKPGHDWCIVRLGLPGIVRGVVVDTAFFRGNYPEACRVEACAAEPDAPLDLLRGPATAWFPLVKKTKLHGDAKNRFEVDSPFRWTHVRLRIFPDGGVARLRVHGTVVPDPTETRGRAGLVNLASLRNGAAMGAVSDEFFGVRHHLLLPGRSRGMFDGWETRRRRGPGHDWAVIRLAGEGTIERVVIDTSHFKGNAPGRVAVDVADDLAALELGAHEGAPWRPLLSWSRVRPHDRRAFVKALADAGPARVARLRIEPDGGVARVRLLGRFTEAGRAQIGIAWFDALDHAAANRALLSCMDSDTWVGRMWSARPFGSLAAALHAATRAGEGVPREDLLQAMERHPRIGESTSAAGPPLGCEAEWSRDEQSAARTDDAATKQALADANARYESKFGHVFLIAARGKSAREILAECERRTALDADAELANAADALVTIARQRLERLILPHEEMR
jgi:allantoicase